MIKMRPIGAHFLPNLQKCCNSDIVTAEEPCYSYLINRNRQESSMKLKETLVQLKIDMEPMTLGQKADHIWSNFKEIILIAGIALAMVVGYLVTLLTAPQPIFAGYMLNVQLSDAGEQAVCQDFLNSIGGSGKQSVELLSGRFVENAKQDQVEYNIVVTTQLAAMMESQSLDFMLTDRYGASFFGKQGYYMDLTALFTAEELANLEGKLIYAQPEDAQAPYPVAVDISATAFAKKELMATGSKYLCIVANTARLDTCRTFYEFVLDYQ